MTDKQPAIVQEINELKARAWNKCMAPRIPSLVSFLRADEWAKGIGAWLTQVREDLRGKLEFGCKTRDDDQFLRGQLAMLKQILDLPAILQNQLDEAEKEKPKPTGSAGY